MSRVWLLALLTLFLANPDWWSLPYERLASTSASIPAERARRNMSRVFAAPLIINEYLADPPAIVGDSNGDGIVSSSQDEFIEVVNAGPGPLEVGGYSIVVGTSTRFTFPADKIIPAGEASVIFGGGTPVGAFGNARALGLVFTASLSLVNGGTTVSVKDNTGATTDSLTYGSSEGSADQSITRSPDITGVFVRHSLAPGAGGRLFSPGTRTDGSTFTSPVPLITAITPDSAVVGSGTVQITLSGSQFEAGSQVFVDGLQVLSTFVSSTELAAELASFILEIAGPHSISVHNPGPVISNAAEFKVLPIVGINELLADPPDGPAGDANGDGLRDSADDEFIEIVNRTAAPADVSGFSLSDADQRRFVFPPGSVIPAREVAVVFGGGRPQGEFGNAAFNGLVFTAPLSLNNGSDTVTLRDRRDSVVETVSYGAEAGQNESLTRFPEAVGTMFVRHSTIVGAGGRKFSPGTRVDGAAFSVAPRLTSINPNRVPLGTREFALSLVGESFEADSIVFVDSMPLGTSFSDSRMLTAMVSPSVASSPGNHLVVVRNPDGNRSNPGGLFVVPPPPVLSTVVPRFVQLGSSSMPLFALGSGFDSGAKVFADDLQMETTFSTPGELRFVLPATLLSTQGQRRIRVRNGDGQESSDLAVEIVLPAVKIGSISPAEVMAGGGAFTLTISGTNFRVGAVVIMDQRPLSTRFVSTTQLTADVSADLVASPGPRSVSVQNSSGDFSNEIALAVRPDAPLIGFIDPERTVEGGNDITLTVSGSKFQKGAVIEVAQPGRAWTGLETDFVSDTLLGTVLPQVLLRAPEKISLRVKNPDFGTSNEVLFNVAIRDPLVINEYLADPPAGLAGDANGDGNRSSSQDEFVELLNRSGDAIDISGYRLTDSESVRHIFQPGTIVPPHESVVVFGGGSPRGRFGNAAENNLVFKASSGGLSLNNGGDTIRLESDFGSLIQEVKFTTTEGSAAESLNRDPDGDGSVFSPHSVISGQTGKLFSPGTRVDGTPFTTKPIIELLDPAGIRAGSPGLSLLVTGKDFLSGAVILFGDQQLPTNSGSPGRLEGRIDQALLVDPGAVEIRVKNPRGELSSPMNFFVIGDPPIISRLTPDRGGTGSDELEVAIEGANFERRAVVTIDGAAVSTRFSSNQSLAFTVPIKFFKTAASLNVRVRNEDGNESSSLTFEVVNGPLLTRLSRRRIKAGRGDTEMGVGGVAFEPGAVLLVNDAAVETRFVSDAQLSVVIPGEFTMTSGSLTLQVRNQNGGRSNKVTLKVIQ